MLLRGFDPSCLAICSMHCINLGLMYGVNGSCLSHVRMTMVMVIPHDACTLRSAFLLILDPRMTIVESTDIFGRHGDLTLQETLALGRPVCCSQYSQEQFDLAYMSFKEFLKTAKIRCSQPPFTVKLATWANYVSLAALVLLGRYACMQEGACRHEKQCFEFMSAQLSHFCHFKVVKSSDEILMTGKAYNNRCIQLWLEHVMRTAAAMHTSDERIGHMSVCMLSGCMHM